MKILKEIGKSIIIFFVTIIFYLVVAFTLFSVFEFFNENINLDFLVPPLLVLALLASVLIFFYFFVSFFIVRFFSKKWGGRWYFGLIIGVALLLFIYLTIALIFLGPRDIPIF